MPAPALNSNTPTIQWQSASGSSANKNAKSTPAESEPPFESHNQTFINAGDQFNLYTWA